MRTLTFLRTIGSGAFGSVYLASLTGGGGFKRLVAVKVLQRSRPDSAMFMSRIRDEARLLGLLQDDAILKVLDMVQIEGMDAVLMEYVDGADLGTLGESGNPPPPRALAEIGAAVAGALSRAHSARHPATGEPLGVIHRDVKPANIMVTTSGGVKLLDFGVARAHFDARESYTGQLVLGTLYYMAPEYIVTGEVSPAADVYGLGLSLWQLAAGEVYGQPKVRQDSHERRLATRLEKIRDAHGYLVPVLERMLAWDPAARPAALEVEHLLQDAADASSGTGLRTWARAVIPQVLDGRETAPDSVGLVGRQVEIAMTADGAARVDPSAVEVEPAPTVLDSTAGSPRPAVDLAAVLPSPMPEPVAPRPRPLPETAPQAPAPPRQPTAQPSLRQPAPPPPTAGSPQPPRRRRRRSSALKIIVQGMVVGGILGLVVVLALILVVLISLPGFP